jgi:roadblock/LC7 domain-containing protein
MDILSKFQLNKNPLMGSGALALAEFTPDGKIITYGYHLAD